MTSSISSNGSHKLRVLFAPRLQLHGFVALNRGTCSHMFPCNTSESISETKPYSFTWHIGIARLYIVHHKCQLPAWCQTTLCFLQKRRYLATMVDHKMLSW